MAESAANTAQLQALLDEGNENAYGELQSIAPTRLQRLARKMLRDFPRLRRWEQTDDAFQTAALRLHRSLSEVKPGSVRQFFGLAATQIRRTLIDLARHHYGPYDAADRIDPVGFEESPWNVTRGNRLALIGRHSANGFRIVRTFEKHEPIESVLQPLATTSDN